MAGRQGEQDNDQTMRTMEPRKRLRTTSSEEGEGLDQRGWIAFIERTLTYFSRNNPEDNAFYCDVRHKIHDFSGLFCYIYKGRFLPSGDQDGTYWKGSQGAKSTGCCLQRRYFYSRAHPDLKRQITWLSEDAEWCFVEYRRGNAGKIVLSDITGPSGFNWPLLIKTVLGDEAPTNLIRLPRATSSSSEEDVKIDLKEREVKRRIVDPRRDYSDPPTQGEAFNFQPIQSITFRHETEQQFHFAPVAVDNRGPYYQFPHHHALSNWQPAYLPPSLVMTHPVLGHLQVPMEWMHPGNTPYNMTGSPLDYYDTMEMMQKSLGEEEEERRRRHA